ncbi:MAG: lipoprotein-releasing system permease protein [Woeseiaceae bacterium]|jgi:lipoprotein-releasing system permease protein|tara:strand:+ start:2001 stop:3248 length:1248 start_codon:yes stop_codon:yes gene_type:complete
MQTRYANWLAFRYVFSKKRGRSVSSISLISLLGIMLAVAVLIIVLSVVNGFEKELKNKLLLMSGHAQIEDPSGKLYEWRSHLNRAKENDRVMAVTPYVRGEGLIVSGQKITSLIFHGINSGLEAQSQEFAKLIQGGDLKDLQQGSYNIILGIDLAKKLNVSIGDKVIINLAEGLTTPMGLFPRSKKLTVSAIFRAGMSEYDSNLALLDLNDAQNLLRMGDSITGLKLSVTNIYTAFEVVREVALSSGGKFMIGDWTQRHVNFFRSIQITKSILFVILMLVIAVAAFNIVSTLVMAVRDKRADVAIMRTSGILPSTVIKIFVIQGTIIGLLGTLLGVFFGVIIALNLEYIVITIEGVFNMKVLSPGVYFISDLPSDLRVNDIITIASISLLLSVISTFYPAWKASKITPSEVLRYD